MGKFRRNNNFVKNQTIQEMFVEKTMDNILDELIDEAKARDKYIKEQTPNFKEQYNSIGNNEQRRRSINK